MSHFLYEKSLTSKNKLNKTQLKHQLEANENNQNSSDYILNITLPNMLSG